MSVADEAHALLVSEDDALPPGLAVSGYFRWKGVLDRLLAAGLLLPGILMIGILVVVVRVASPGPGIFTQVRVGKNGRKFTMYKIRTMRVDAESKTGAVWCQCNDPRVTRLGKVLRKLHLDELPQLFNVLLGQMSLVGPRPERPSFVIVLDQEIPGYSTRLTVAPGITGMAQINLPPDTDVTSVRRKLVLDQEYIESGSLLMDLRILLCTSLRIIGIPGIAAAKLTFLCRTVELPVEIDATAQGSFDGPATPGSILRQDQAATEWTTLRGIPHSTILAAAESEMNGSEGSATTSDIRVRRPR